MTDKPTQLFTPDEAQENEWKAQFGIGQHTFTPDDGAGDCTECGESACHPIHGLVEVDSTLKAAEEFGAARERDRILRLRVPRKWPRANPTSWDEAHRVRAEATAYRKGWTAALRAYRRRIRETTEEQTCQKQS